MRFDMFLQILGTLESLVTELAFVWLQRNVNAYMRGDMVTLDYGCATTAPAACQVAVVGALATDMTFADVILSDCFSKIAWHID